MKFLELVNKRRSVRAYSPCPIEKEKLQYVFECVRMAPSAVNRQPWHFRVIEEGKELEAVKATYPREWMQSVHCLVVACVNHEESWHRPSDGKDHGDIDAAIAVEHFCLAAAEVGLGTCWVCNFDVPLCRKALGLTDSYEPVALLPIGYPADEAPVSEKKRKPLSEMVDGIDLLPL